MIFVDSSVFRYAVGREHPLRSKARDFIRQHVGRASGFVTPAEVAELERLPASSPGRSKGWKFDRDEIHRRP